MSALFLSLAAFALLAFAPPSQAKTAVNGFGFTHPALAGNALGGTFLSTGSGGIAVNNSGAGAARGTFYAIHRDRVQRFGPAGAWQRTWGEDVIATSYDERQFLEVAATGGTYTLSFEGQTTDPLAYDTPGVEVIAALNGLSTIGGNVKNLFGDYSCLSGNGLCFWDFIGPFAATDVPQVTVDSSQLDGAAKVITLVEGVDAATTGGSSTGFEICTVAGHCKFGTASGTAANGGQLKNPQGVAVNQANGHVYVAEQGNRRVSEFDADGNFIRAWGWDVTVSGRPGDVSTDDFEICTAAADCTQAAAAGVNGGQFGGTLGFPVVDSSGNVWVPDFGNRRIQEFDSSGNFIAAYGYGVNGGAALERCASTTAGVCRAGTQGTGAGQFSSNNPKQIAFDNLGNLYAIDAGNNRVQRFDPAFTTASNFASATFSGLSTAAPEQMVATMGGARIAFAINRNIGTPAERQIVELDPTDAGVRDTSLAGSGLTSAVNGLAVDATTDNLYATISDAATRYRILLLGATPPGVGVSHNTPSVAGDTAVTLLGSVDPKGAWVGNCKFQYSTDQVAWEDVPASGCEALDLNGGPQAIGAGTGGLQPNTQYYARLQASRPLVPNSTVTSFTRTFRTDSVPPVVSDVGAVQIADTSARMVGTIDPRNSATGYILEYGTTPALGSSTAPLNIGGGTTPITVSQVIGGLSPDTGYYFRLVATNAFGATPSDQETITTRADPPPDPGGRGLEVVTPPDKNYGDADNVVASYPPNRAAASPDGDSVGFCSAALFGDPPSRMTNLCAPYISRRGASGWGTSHPFPRFCSINPFSGAYEALQLVALSRDYSRYVVQQPESADCEDPLLDPSAPTNEDPITTALNLYYEDPSTDPFGYQLLTPAVAPLYPESGPVRWLGGSEDFSRVVYSSGVNQTPQPDSPPPSSASQRLYLWQLHGVGGCAQPGGCLSLLSKDPNGDPFLGGGNIPMTFSIGGSPFVNYSAVSSDGERIFFQNPGSPPGWQFSISGGCPGSGCDLYVREAGTTTIKVSESECTLGAACGNPQSKSDEFVYATPSGHRAFFLSCARLTDTSGPEGCIQGSAFYPQGDTFGPASSADGQIGAKLYRWDATAPPGSRLVDLMLDPEPGNGLDPRFRRWLGLSDDGNTAFFVASGQLILGGANAPSVYRWRWNGGSPKVDYLGPYEPVMGTNSADVNGVGLRRLVTPDGNYLMLYSALPLDPAADRDTDIDVYRWDEDGGWLCASCQVPGEPSAGHIDLEHVRLPHYETAYPSIASFEQRTLMSDDGRRIFFGTPDALVPEDTNGEVACPIDDIDAAAVDAHTYACTDIYEWHDGTVSIVSSGAGTSAARLIESTPSGRDVFFYTRERLVGWDVDLNTDIYNARIGGGFPEPPAQPPACEGEACRGPATVAAGIPGAGSARFEGPGNPRDGGGNTCGRFSKKAKRKAQAARKAARRGQTKRARALRRQANNLNRRAKRCNRRAAR